MKTDQWIITGRGIALRELIDSDLDFLVQVLGDQEVMRYWPETLDRAGSEEWLQKQLKRYHDDGCGFWLIVDTQTQQQVGVAGVLMTEVEGERLPSLGYMIHRPFWRQGYATNAASLSIEYIFHTMNRPRAYTLIRPENEPSLAVARKLNMKPLRTVQFVDLEHILFARDRE